MSLVSLYEHQRPSTRDSRPRRPQNFAACQGAAPRGMMEPVPDGGCPAAHSLRRCEP
ncbi:hypothetical protein SUBVAR_04093 [Subdoligranulum variabile DSM 15176]|uniref:Uncharacterized protein n=1 Tax=Subdoligranulum variabile DSM 15176 TaxID=411471 RepID=D1PIC8_9FIRM|nr:hypothetical protein SUBVAR_04093 [Subdoligranulum variabile DSM 15176]